MYSNVYMGFMSGAVVKNLPSNAGDAKDMALIHELGRSFGEGTPLEEVLTTSWTVAQSPNLSLPTLTPW